MISNHRDSESGRYVTVGPIHHSRSSSFTTFFRLETPHASSSNGSRPTPSPRWSDSIFNAFASSFKKNFVASTPDGLGRQLALLLRHFCLPRSYLRMELEIFRDTSMSVGLTIPVVGHVPSALAAHMTRRSLDLPRQSTGWQDQGSAMGNWNQRRSGPGFDIPDRCSGRAEIEDGM
ncbi:hypothetical protein OG21DRAFT_1526259 [Imleria badia]|nr:hypothetical protein OG21DRAFT_1526259 [Imleria badia]